VRRSRTQHQKIQSYFPYHEITLKVTAEVLQGLLKAYDDYNNESESVWKTP
jgi:hypothetical protein